MNDTSDTQQQDMFTDCADGQDMRWPLHDRKEVLCSPAQARKAYDCYQFRRQREISRAHVTKYAQAMKAGTFKPLSVITIAMASDGAKFLVDGNHTLLAIEEYGHPFPITVEIRGVKDEADAAVLYSTFEARKRSLAAHMCAAGLDENTGVSPSMLAHFCPGLNMLELEFPAKIPRLQDSAARQALISRWAPWCKPIASILAGAPFNKMLEKRSATIALMFLTMKYQPEKAKTFWSDIANNRDLHETDPKHTAFTYLSSTGGKACSAAEQFAALSLAWNAYIDGRPIGILRVFCGPIKVTVKGTPWTNRLTGGVKTERRS